MMVTGANAVYIRPLIGVTQSFSLELYEGITVSADGTPVVVANRNRTSSNVALSTVFRAPTVTDLGLQLLDDIAVGGTGPLAPGVSTSVAEWVLKPNTKYLLRLIHDIGVGEAEMSVTLNWTEGE